MSNDAANETRQNKANQQKCVLKKQMTYSFGMKLDATDSIDKSNANVDNKLHRCEEVENLTVKQEEENELMNQDIDALHFKTHLKRTPDVENLNNSEIINE